MAGKERVKVAVVAGLYRYPVKSMRGEAVAAAHSALREEIPFLDRDRAMDGEVAVAVRLVESGKLLDAARIALA